jgi:predicted Zn finger-like uncharacterized protein
MALATQCPHCHTTFRVASDQLKLRGGIVRCGSCQRIFDGSAHLIDLEALAARKALDAAAAADAAASPAAGPTADSTADAAAAAPSPAAAQAPEATPEPAPAPAPALPEREAAGPGSDAGDEPVYTLDFDHAFDPFGILPKVEPVLDAAPPARQEGAAEADDVDEAADDLPPAPDVQAEADAPAGADIQPVPPAERIEPGSGPLPDQDAPLHAHEAGNADAAAAATSEPEPEPEPQPEPAPDLEPQPAPASVPAHAYAPAGRIEPSFDLPVDEELVAQPLPGHEPDPALDPEHPADAAPELPPGAARRPAPWLEPANADVPPAALPLRASADADPLHATQGGTAPPAPRSARARAAEARARRSKMTPTRIEAPKLRMPAEPDEPEFVKRSRRQEQSGRTVRILLAVGAAVLLLLLAAQLLLNFRNELAVRHPAARPLLSSLCAVAGCHVGLPAQAENLVIDDGELASLGPDTYTLNTQLRNQGSLVLAWPSIELELTDANNKPVLRRVFGPADYLPPGTQVAAGFGAHAEQPVRLNFALADLKPSGYHTFVFYP